MSNCPVIASVMHLLVLALALLPCTYHGRRVHMSSSQVDSRSSQSIDDADVDALKMLLLIPSGARQVGLASAGRRLAMSKPSQRQRVHGRSPLMQNGYLVADEADDEWDDYEEYEEYEEEDEEDGEDKLKADTPEARREAARKAAMEAFQNRFAVNEEENARYKVNTINQVQINLKDFKDVETEAEEGFGRKSTVASEQPIDDIDQLLHDQFHGTYQEFPEISYGTKSEFSTGRMLWTGGLGKETGDKKDEDEDDGDWEEDLQDSVFDDIAGVKTVHALGTPETRGRLMRMTVGRTGKGFHKTHLALMNSMNREDEDPYFSKDDEFVDGVPLLSLEEDEVEDTGPKYDTEYLPFGEWKTKIPETNDDALSALEDDE